MPLAVTQNWGLPTLQGKVAFQPIPSGTPINAQIIGGVLTDTSGNLAVTVPASTDPQGPQHYLVKFRGLTIGAGGFTTAVEIPTFTFAAGGDVVLGDIFFPGLTPAATGTVPYRYEYCSEETMLSVAPPQYSQASDAILDYTLDWTLWLEGIDDSIALVTFTSDPNAIEVVSSNTTATTATGWLTGGEIGQTYRITAHITTLHGRQDDRTFTLFITQT